MTHLLKDNTPIAIGDRVTDGVNTFMVAKVLEEDWSPALRSECRDAGIDSGWHLDLEFIDPDGKYHHYISWADGGGVIRHKVNVGYLIDWQKVRELCIKRNWYTMGTNEEYEHLLLEVIPEGLADIDNVMEIASDIYNHTDVQLIKDESGYDTPEVLGMIASDILNRCTYTGVTL